MSDESPKAAVLSAFFRGAELIAAWSIFLAHDYCEHGAVTELHRDYEERVGDDVVSMTDAILYGAHHLSELGYSFEGVEVARDDDGRYMFRPLSDEPLGGAQNLIWGRSPAQAIRVGINFVRENVPDAEEDLRMLQERLNHELEIEG